MKRLWLTFVSFLGTITVLFPAISQAAGGGKVANVVIVADPRKVHGLLAWWANLYNESHLYFTLVTIIIVPLVGVAFGILADLIMTAIGIDLKSRELAEH